MASIRYCAGASSQSVVQQQPQTINPALLLNQRTNVIQSSEDHSQSINATNFTQPPPSNNPSPSPFSANGRDVWMGSSGYPANFTRRTLGNYQPNWNVSFRHEREPLTPLFGLQQHIPRLPSMPPLLRTPPAPRFRPNTGWAAQHRQPTYFNANVKVVCNGQERLVPHRAYVMQTRVR